MHGHGATITAVVVALLMSCAPAAHGYVRIEPYMQALFPDGSLTVDNDQGQSNIMRAERGMAPLSCEISFILLEVEHFGMIENIHIRTL